jgi:transposase-like protein
VLRLLSKVEPKAQIARRAGISEQTLYRWREEFIAGGIEGWKANPSVADERTTGF